ncbi:MULTISPECIES: anti-sigma factor [Microbacterium]|uniref:anti-sigma factor n=1 Tax=Microbacterium TaxID=33882 RepID=UPI00146C5036|nr:MULTISPECIES: anti-sigma factor [Microbacterium]
MDEQEFAELAAGYVLGSLSPEDRLVFDEARATHPEWEHWIVEDAAIAAALAEAVPDAAPPLTARSTLLARIGTMPQVPALEIEDPAAADPLAGPVEVPPLPELTAEEASVLPPAPPATDPAPTTTTIQAVSRRNWTRGLLTLAASLVVLVTLGFGAVTLNEYVNRPPEVVALDEIESAPDAESATFDLEEGGTATAHWSASIGKAVLVSDGLPEIADDESFELWFVREGGEPVSAGVFEASGGTSTAILDGELQPGDTIAVTIEPQGGSPDGQPSSDPIIAIPTA